MTYLQISLSDCGLAIVAMTCALAASVGNATPTCTPTRISRAEATTLLFLVPALLEAKAAGRIPAPEPWMPEDSNRYIYFEVRTWNSPDADGGLIGWYAVSAITAQVYEAIPEVSPINNGSELNSAMATIRAKHCISANVIAKEEKAPPLS
jgi:hypothetical protein